MVASPIFTEEKGNQKVVTRNEVRSQPTVGGKSSSAQEELGHCALANEDVSC